MLYLVLTWTLQGSLGLNLLWALRDSRGVLSPDETSFRDYVAGILAGLILGPLTIAFAICKWKIDES